MKIPFMSNLKKPACASKRDVLELATLQYMPWDTFSTWIFNLGPFFGQSGLQRFFLKQFLSCEAIFLSRVRYLKFILGANSKNGAHLLNLMHRYTSPWMIKFRVSSQGDLQTSNDQIKIKVLPLTLLLWIFFSIDTLISKKVKGTRRIYT